MRWWSGPRTAFFNGGRNERPFFLRQRSWLWISNKKLRVALKFPEKQADKTVFLNDSNCYWQSICSAIALLFWRENVCSKPLLVGVEFPWFVCDQAFLWNCKVATFWFFLGKLWTQYLLLKNRACRTSPGSVTLLDGLAPRMRASQAEPRSPSC